MSAFCFFFFLFHFSFTFVKSQNNGKYANVAAARFYGHKLHFVITLLSFCFLQRRFFFNLFDFFFLLSFQTRTTEKNSCSQVSLFKKKKRNEITDTMHCSGVRILHFHKIENKSLSHPMDGPVSRVRVRELCSESGRVIYICFSICIVRAIRLSTCTVCVIVYLDTGCCVSH